MKNKIIFHLDLDCFFCRCEEIVNHYLELQPFVIANNHPKAVISTSNMIARKFKIKSAMIVDNAKRLCPNLKTVEPHFDLYKQKSSEFFACIRNNFTSEIEVMSIDECFLDATKLIEEYHNNYEILAQAIIDKVYKETKLNVTIGIGNNKFLAKMAGDTKPKSRIAKIFVNEIKQKIWPLHIEKVFGIGKKTTEMLKELGIYRVNDFINFNDQKLLQNLLHKGYDDLFKKLTGNSSDAVNYNFKQPKSLDKSKTFDVLTDDYLYIKRIIKFLADEVYQELVSYNISCSKLSIKIKYENSQQKSKTRSFNYYFSNLESMQKEFVNLFNELWNESQIRLIGVGVSDFIDYKQVLIQERVN